MKTNINNTQTWVNTQKNILATSIEEMLWTKQYHEQLLSILNMDEVTQWKNEILVSVSNILDENNWLETERRLANMFWLSEQDKRKLEKDYKPQLTLAWVMDDAEQFFNSANEWQFLKQAA